jgi:hypothetical protein
MKDYATGPVCTVSGNTILRTDNAVPTSGVNALYVSNCCGNYATTGCNTTGPVSGWTCPDLDEFCFREVVVPTNLQFGGLTHPGAWPNITNPFTATPAVDTFTPLNLTYTLDDLRTGILSGSFVQMVTGYGTFGAQPVSCDWPVWHNLPAQENHGAKPLYVWYGHDWAHSGPFYLTAKHPVDPTGGWINGGITIVASTFQQKYCCWPMDSLGGCNIVYNKNAAGIPLIHPTRILQLGGSFTNPIWWNWWGRQGLSAGFGFGHCSGLSATSIAACTADCGLSGTCYEMHLCLSGYGSSGVDSSSPIQVCDKDDYESINNGLSAGSFCTAVHCGTNMPSTGQLISVIDPCSASEFVIDSTCARQDCECIWPNPPFSTSICVISASGASDWMNGTWSSMNQGTYSGLPVYYKSDGVNNEGWMHYGTVNPGFSPSSWQVGNQHPAVSGENYYWAYKNETGSGASPYATTTQWTDHGAGDMYVKEHCGNATCCGLSGSCYIFWPCTGTDSGNINVDGLSGLEVCDKDGLHATLWGVIGSDGIPFLSAGQFVKVTQCPTGTEIPGKLVQCLSASGCYDPTHYITTVCMGSNSNDCYCDH